MQQSHAPDAPRINLGDISRALETQFRVIWALMLRETKTRAVSFFP